MNSNNLLKFICKTVIENTLFEKISVQKFCNGKKIEDKDIIEKRTNVNKLIVPISLKIGKSLLVEDYPMNFLLSHTILIGTDCDLFEFSFKKENHKYIADSKIVEKLKDKIDEKSISEFNYRKLYKIEFEFLFERLKLIEEIVKYTEKFKNINLNKLHIVKSEKVENFVPTIKSTHLKLAREMSLPIVSLIENSFLRDTSINVNDFLKQVEILKPVYNEEIREVWEFEKELGSKIYKDISNDYYIKINLEDMKDKILNSKTSIDKNELIELVFSIKKLKISENFGEEPLPIWKTLKGQKFIQIKDKNHFKEITGIEYENAKSNFSEIYILSGSGEEGIYKNKFLKKKLVGIFENIKINSSVTFESVEELVIKLILNDDVKTIKRVEKVDKEKVRLFVKKVHFIFDKILDYAIKFNDIHILDQTLILNKYLTSCVNSLEGAFENYNENKSKEIFLEKSLMYVEVLCEILKTINIKKENISLLCSNLLMYINILNVFDEKESNECKKKFLQYFKDQTFEVRKLSPKKNLEELFEGVATANKMAKKHETSIFFKEKIEDKFLSKNVNILETEPEYKMYKGKRGKSKKVYLKFKIVCENNYFVLFLKTSAN